MNRTLFSIAIAVGVLCLGGARAQAGDEVAQIKSKGSITFGVKADYPPFGSRVADGSIQGIEIDLAKDIAQRLGVKAVFVPVNAANRIQFLQQGQVDVLIATVGDTPERAKLVDFVHPNYYASGYNVMLLKADEPSSWEGLKGKQICAVQGAYYNKPAAERFGLQLVAFRGVAEATTAMQQNRCSGFLFDDTGLMAQLALPQWAAYDMPLPSQDSGPWGIATRLGAADLEKAIADAEIQWFKKGTIQSLGDPIWPQAALYLRAGASAEIQAIIYQLIGPGIIPGPVIFGGA